MRAIPEVEVFCSFYSTAICNAKKMQHCSSCIFLSIYSYVYCHFVEQAKKMFLRIDLILFSSSFLDSKKVNNV